MNDTFNIARIDVDGGEAAMTTEFEALKGVTGVTLRGYSCATAGEIIAAAKDADVIITHHADISAPVLGALPRLRAVVRYGVGYDTVDVEAATACGVYVVNIPDFCSEEVSNHVIMFMLAFCKKLIPLNALVKQGRWNEANASLKPMGCVHGETLGIVGCGNLGRHVAKKAAAFNMKVIGYDKYLPADVAAAAGIELVPFDELLARADYISVHTVLNAETFHIIDAAALKKMKPGCVLINASRGATVDEQALIEALKNKEIAGACLDVLEQEPPQTDNGLFALDNVYLLPHSASYSDEAFRLLDRSVIEEALRIKNGERPRSVVNRGVVPKS